MPNCDFEVILRILQTHDSKCQHVHFLQTWALHIDVRDSAKYHNHEVLVAHANSIFYQHIQTKIIVFFV